MMSSSPNKIGIQNQQWGLCTRRERYSTYGDWSSERRSRFISMTQHVDCWKDQNLLLNLAIGLFQSSTEMVVPNGWRGLILRFFPLDARCSSHLL